MVYYTGNSASLLLPAARRLDLAARRLDPAPSLSSLNIVTRLYLALLCRIGNRFGFGALANFLD